MSDAVVLLGCGDVGPIHEPMAQYSELVRDTLAAADIRFAQVERVYSERGELRPHGGAHGRLPPHLASVITDCGFNVVSVAGPAVKSAKKFPVFALDKLKWKSALKGISCINVPEAASVVLLFRFISAGMLQVFVTRAFM